MTTKEEREAAKIMKAKTAVYIGTADVRIITGDDLRTLGIKYDGPALVFHAGNRFALPVEDLPTEVVDHLDDIEPDISVQDGIPDNLLQFIRTKVATTSVSGRQVGVQALQGREEFPSPHPEAQTIGQAPVISPEAPLPHEGKEAEAVEGGGNTSPVTTAGGSANDSVTGTSSSRGR